VKLRGNWSSTERVSILRQQSGLSDLRVRSHPLWGVAWMVSATCGFVASDTISKSLLQDYAIAQVIWARYTVHFLVILALMARFLPEALRKGPRFSDRPISEISGVLMPPAAHRVHRNTRRPVSAGPAPCVGAERCRNESTDRGLVRASAGSHRPSDRRPRTSRCAKGAR